MKRDESTVNESTLMGPLSFFYVQDQHNMAEEPGPPPPLPPPPPPSPPPNERLSACPYCAALIGRNYVRHLERHHDKEPEVKALLSVTYPEDEERQRRERRRIGDSIRARGNDKHNNSRHRPENLLIPARRTQRPTNEHVTCLGCRKWFVRGRFYRRHFRMCKKRGPPNHNSARLEETRRTLQQQLRRGAEPDVGLADPFILSLSDRYIRGHRRQSGVATACTRLRDAARLLMRVRIATSDAEVPVINFEDMLRPERYEVVVSAVRELTGIDTHTGDVRVVGMPKRLREVLRDALNLRRDEAVMNPSLSEEVRDRVRRETDDFSRLLEHRWADDIGRLARDTQLRARCAKSNILPDDDDVRTFIRAAGEQQDLCRQRFEDNSSPRNFEGLCEAVIAVLTSRNRRRRSEVSSTSYSSWHGRPASNENPQEGAVTPAYCLVPGGKQTARLVPIIVDRDTERCIDLIVNSRRSVGVPDPRMGLDLGGGLRREVGPHMANVANDLLFPRINTQRPFNTSAIIARLRRNLPLRNPCLITTGLLRRHYATRSAEREGVAAVDLLDQMGHCRETHEKWYVVPHQAPGAISRMAKRLDQANQDDVPEPIAGPSGLQPDTDDDTDASSTDDGGEEDDDGGDDHPRALKVVDEDEEPPAYQLPEGDIPDRRRGTIESRRWTEAETQAVQQMFVEQLLERRMPTWQEVVNRTQEGQGIPGRSVAAIRTRAYHILSRLGENPPARGGGDR